MFLPPNQSHQGELKAIKELRHDKTQVTLTAYKGMVIVVLNKQGYIRKADNLLEWQGTHRTISADPTNKPRTS